ncbi:MAG TPA: hypothetical protein VIH61_06890, partial [Waddliaceae bacterium]
AHAENLEGNSTDMHQVRYQLREAALNLCQKLSIYSGRGKDCPELSEEQLTKFYATALDIIERVDQADQRVQKAALRPISKLKEGGGVPYLEVPLSFSLGLYSFNNVDQVADFSDIDISTPFFRRKHKISRKLFFTELANLNNATVRMDREEAIFEIEAYFSSLPVPVKYPNDPHWSKVKNFHPDQLASMLKKYIDLSMESGRILHTPNQYNTVMQMLAIMHQLCWQFDANRSEGFLKDLSLGLDFFGDLYLKDPFLVAKDPESWERGESLLRYFRSVKKPKNEIFDYSKIRDIKNEGFKSEFDLYVNILKCKPAYIEEIKRNGLVELRKKWKNLDLDDLKLISLYAGFCREDFFEDANHAHIECLRDMMINSLVSLGVGNAHRQASSNPTISIGDWSGVIDIQSCGKFSPHYDACKNFLKGAKSAWEHEVVQEFSKPYLEPYLERAPEKVKEFGQGAHLQAQIAQTDEEKNLSNLASAACEPDSAIATLLCKLLENLSIVENPKAQALIQYLLHKPYFKIGGENPVIPLFEDLKDRPEATLQFFQNVIEKGIQLHYSLRSTENANVSAALYFIRLGQQISKAYFQIHHKKVPLSLYSENILEEIEAMLRTKTPIPLPLLADVALHQMQELMVPYKAWTSECWSATYSKWLAVCSLSGIDRQQEIDRSLYQEIKEQMRILEPGLMRKTESDKDFTENFLNQITSELGLDGNYESSWFNRNQFSNKPSKFNGKGWKRVRNEVNTLTFCTWLQDMGKVAINLATGQILSDHGFLSLGRTNNEDRNFLRIFDQRNLQITGYEKTTQFTDEFYGECRIIKGKQEQFIQRKVGNNWFTYTSPQSLGGFLPVALLGGYSHWEGRESATGKNVMLISDQKTGKDCWYVNETGAIRAWQNNSANTKEFLGLFRAENFIAVENPDYILPWVDADGRMTRLEFVRFKTKEGRCLSFNCKEDRWFYNSDSHYQLEIQTKDSYLGNFPHFISLVHEDGERRKLLVPNHGIISKGFSTKPEIVIVNEEGELDPHDRIYTYFEFNVVNGEAVAEDLEGWLKLTQIFLAQKNYERAVYCLNKVTLSDEITPLARDLFKEILSSGSDLNDYSPNACALRLKAFWLANKLDPFTLGYRDITKLGQHTEHTKVADIYTTYLSGLNHVYQPLRLSAAIEKELIPMLGDNKQFCRREEFLETGSYTHVPFAERVFASPPQPGVDLQL